MPKGTVTKHVWDKSKVFPGTTRDYWIYVPAQYKKAKEGKGGKEQENPRSNRSAEYDTLSDDYAKFLLKEILPEVPKTCTLADKPDGRCIAPSAGSGRTSSASASPTSAAATSIPR